MEVVLCKCWHLARRHMERPTRPGSRQNWAYQSSSPLAFAGFYTLIGRRMPSKQGHALQKPQSWNRSSTPMRPGQQSRSPTLSRHQPEVSYPCTLPTASHEGCGSGAETPVPLYLSFVEVLLMYTTPKLIHYVQLQDAAVAPLWPSPRKSRPAICRCRGRCQTHILARR
jgi:hypothetical protein